METESKGVKNANRMRSSRSVIRKNIKELLLIYHKYKVKHNRLRKKSVLGKEVTKLKKFKHKWERFEKYHKSLLNSIKNGRKQVVIQCDCASDKVGTLQKMVSMLKRKRHLKLSKKKDIERVEITVRDWIGGKFNEANEKFMKYKKLWEEQLEIIKKLEIKVMKTEGLLKNSNQMCSQFQREKKLDFQHHKDILKDKNSEIREKTIEVNKLKKKIEDLNNKYQKNLDMISFLDTALMNLKRRTYPENSEEQFGKKPNESESRIIVLEKKLTEVNEKFERCKAFLHQQRNEINSLKLAKQNSLKEMIELREVNKKLSESYRRFLQHSALSDKRRTKIKSMKKKIKNLNLEITQLKIALVEMKEKCSQYKASADIKDTEVKQLQEQINIKDTEVNQLQEQINIKDTKFNQLLEQINIKDTKVNQLLEQINIIQLKVMPGLERVTEKRPLEPSDTLAVTCVTKKVKSLQSGEAFVSSVDNNEIVTYAGATTGSLCDFVPVMQSTTQDIPSNEIGLNQDVIPVMPALTTKLKSGKKTSRHVSMHKKQECKKCKTSCVSQNNAQQCTREKLPEVPHNLTYPNKKTILDRTTHLNFGKSILSMYLKNSKDFSSLINEIPEEYVEGNPKDNEETIPKYNVKESIPKHNVKESLSKDNVKENIPKENVKESISKDNVKESAPKNNNKQESYADSDTLSNNRKESFGICLRSHKEELKLENKTNKINVKDSTPKDGEKESIPKDNVKESAPKNNVKESIPKDNVKIAPKDNVKESIPKDNVKEGDPMDNDKESHADSDTLSNNRKTNFYMFLRSCKEVSNLDNKAAKDNVKESTSKDNEKVSIPKDNVKESILDGNIKKCVPKEYIKECVPEEYVNKNCAESDTLTVKTHKKSRKSKRLKRLNNLNPKDKKFRQLCTMQARVDVSNLDLNPQACKIHFSYDQHCTKNQKSSEECYDCSKVLKRPLPTITKPERTDVTCASETENIQTEDNDSDMFVEHENLVIVSDDEILSNPTNVTEKDIDKECTDIFNNTEKLSSEAKYVTEINKNISVVTKSSGIEIKSQNQSPSDLSSEVQNDTVTAALHTDDNRISENSVVSEIVVMESDRMAVAVENFDIQRETFEVVSDNVTKNTKDTVGSSFSNGNIMISKTTEAIPRNFNVETVADGQAVLAFSSKIKKNRARTAVSFISAEETVKTKSDHEMFSVISMDTHTHTKDDAMVAGNRCFNAGCDAAGKEVDSQLLPTELLPRSSETTMETCVIGLFEDLPDENEYNQTLEHESKVIMNPEEKPEEFSFYQSSIADKSIRKYERKVMKGKSKVSQQKYAKETCDALNFLLNRKGLTVSKVVRFKNV